MKWDMSPRGCQDAGAQSGPVFSILPFGNHSQRDVLAGSVCLSSHRTCWDTLAAHTAGCPVLCPRTCPHHTTLSSRYLGPFQSCWEAEAPARSPQFVPWTWDPGPTIPRQQLLSTGAKLASASSETRVQMRIKKLCIQLPTPNLSLSSSPASSFAQMLQLSIQQFGSSFCLTFSTPSLEATVPTWLSTVKPGA